MHELSLSYATVETVLESVAQHKIKRVKAVSLIVGELSGVSLDAFRFSFPIAAEGTVLEGCDLNIEVEPVTVYCPTCNATGKLASLTRFRCPVCDTPTADLVSGKQFSIVAIDVEMTDEPHNEYANC